MIKNSSSVPPPATSALKGWISLFRPPNLFTVPGDPLVGALLAALALKVTPHWSSVYTVMGAALAFYASGLLANDCFDRALDARERPNRPIPSGAVSAMAVIGVALLLSLAGILMTLPAGRTAFTIGLLLTLASWFYNAFGKGMVWLAPFSMGICRGLSLMLGAAVLGFDGLKTSAVLVAALFMTLYIALITLIARDEADPESSPIPNWSRWGIPIILTTGLMYFLFQAGFPMGLHWNSLPVLMTVMSILWAALWIFQMKPNASPRLIQKSIGGLIRGLLFTQAALCATYSGAGEGFALLLLFLFPVSGWIGRWFYGS